MVIMSWDATAIELLNGFTERLHRTFESDQRKTIYNEHLMRALDKLNDS